MILSIGYFIILKIANGETFIMFYAETSTTVIKAIPWKQYLYIGSVETIREI